MNGEGLIIFVRHGESETNKFIHDSNNNYEDYEEHKELSQKINSNGNPNLTKLGKAQAEFTARFLMKKLKKMGSPKVEVNISLYNRAQQTAEPFIELYGEYIAHHTTPELLEWTPKKKKLSQAHLDSGLKHDNSWDEFQDRVKRFVETLNENSTIKIIFGHSMFISAVISYLASQKEWFPSIDQLCFQLPNCSISTVLKKPKRWATHYVGSISHLADPLVTGTESEFGHN